MGGLVARYVARQPTPTNLAAVITLGTPHHGTDAATLLPGLRALAIPPSPGMSPLGPGVWDAQFPLPLPNAVPLHTLAGYVPCDAEPGDGSLRLTHDYLCDGQQEHNDGVVPVASALPTTSSRAPQQPREGVDHTALVRDPDELRTVVELLRIYLPASLAISSGDRQSGPTATVLAQSLAVRLTNNVGSPVVGVQVAFSANNGSTSPATALTGPDGVAQARWTLGSTAGRRRRPQPPLGSPPRRSRSPLLQPPRVRRRGPKPTCSGPLTIPT